MIQIQSSITDPQLPRPCLSPRQASFRWRYCWTRHSLRRELQGLYSHHATSTWQLDSSAYFKDADSSGKHLLDLFTDFRLLLHFSPSSFASTRISHSTPQLFNLYLPSNLSVDLWHARIREQASRRSCSSCRSSSWGQDWWRSCLNLLKFTKKVGKILYGVKKCRMGGLSFSVFLGSSSRFGEDVGFLMMEREKRRERGTNWIFQLLVFFSTFRSLWKPSFFILSFSWRLFLSLSAVVSHTFLWLKIWFLVFNFFLLYNSTLNCYSSPNHYLHLPPLSNSKQIRIPMKEMRTFFLRINKHDLQSFPSLIRLIQTAKKRMALNQLCSSSFDSFSERVESSGRS